ncbi:hypothetical protein FTX61_05735 [Nitriliruptoraceae bacterium ZYF776]|nr:hypothetical protein [Profundirhabdus halotolerans]
MSHHDLPDHGQGFDGFGLTDPGWLPRGGSAPIGPMRLVFLGVLQALVLLAVVVVFALPVTPDDGAIDPIGWALAGLSVPAAAAGIVVGRRPLSTPSLAAFRTRMFLGIALADAAALVGFMAAFVAEAAVLYLATGAIGVLTLLAIAPTDARLRADDLALQRQGQNASVRAEAYGAPPMGTR